MPSTTFGFVVQTHTRKHLLLFCIFYLGFSFKFIGLSDSNVGRINPVKPFKYTTCVWRLVWSDQNQINLTSTFHLLLKREPKGRGFTRRHCPSNVFPISVVFAAFNIVEHTQADLSVGCVLFIQKNSFILPSLTNVFFYFLRRLNVCTPSNIRISKMCLQIHHSKQKEGKSSAANFGNCVWIKYSACWGAGLSFCQSTALDPSSRFKGHRQRKRLGIYKELLYKKGHGPEICMVRRGWFSLRLEEDKCLLCLVMWETERAADYC